MKTRTHIILGSIAWLAVAAALLRVFLGTPVEANMGIVQKIFYFHVPSAYSMYLSWAVCAGASVAYLWKRSEKADMLAVSAAELALLFALIVMTTGPVWGRKSWGAFWTWDPRLTTTLLMTLLISAYVALRALASGEAERRFAAALSIFGLTLAPLIHFSVLKRRGQHPAVITGKGGGLAPEMGITFAICMVAFTALFVVLVHRRYRLESTRRRLGYLQMRATTIGISEEAEQWVTCAW